jgi:hypothetical protein
MLSNRQAGWYWIKIWMSTEVTGLESQADWVAQLWTGDEWQDPHSEDPAYPIIDFGSKIEPPASGNPPKDGELLDIAFYWAKLKASEDWQIGWSNTNGLRIKNIGYVPLSEFYLIGPKLVTPTE